MHNYHLELYYIAGSSLAPVRKLRAEYHLIAGDHTERKTIPLSQAFICTTCGEVYARRIILESPNDWPATHWIAVLDKCPKHGGGGILKSNELAPSDRYPEPIPLSIMLYEFNCEFGIGSGLLTNISPCDNITMFSKSGSTIMELHEAIAKVNAVRQKVIAAKAGAGEYPSQEEIREAILLLRQGRAAAASGNPKGKKKAEPAKPLDLEALFKNVGK